MKKIALLSGMLLLCAPAGLRAQDEAGKQGPCKADYEKLCKDVKPGQGRILQCMKEHQADLSKGCRERLAKAKEKLKQAKAGFDNACGGDVKSFCGDAQDGRGAVMKCLRQHRKDMSDGCKSFLKEKRRQRKDRRARRAERKGGDQGQGARQGGDQGGGPSDGAQGQSSDSGQEDSGSQE